MRWWHHWWFQTLEMEDLNPTVMVISFFRVLKWIWMVVWVCLLSYISDISSLAYIIKTILFSYPLYHCGHCYYFTMFKTFVPWWLWLYCVSLPNDKNILITLFHCPLTLITLLLLLIDKHIHMMLCSLGQDLLKILKVACSLWSSFTCI